jgi:primosomal protein N' (replication factor Y)
MRPPACSSKIPPAHCSTFSRSLLQCRMTGDARLSTPIETETLYADVIVPRHLTRPFTYMVPAHLQSVLRIGHVVSVPFGRSLIHGAVIAVTGNPPAGLDRQRLKSICALITAGRASEISPSLLELARWVAETYVAPYGQCLRLVLPPRARTPDRSRILLTRKGEEALATGGLPTQTELELLKRLKRRPLGIPLSRLRVGKTRCSEDVLATILTREWVHKVPGRPASHAVPSQPLMTSGSPDLWYAEVGQHKEAFQAMEPSLPEWHARVDEALGRREAARLLVEAAPGERLALLRHAVDRTVALGRRVLVITGETARAESLALALHDPTRVTTCLHSTIPDEKKADIWNLIREDKVSVVVGTRSAVFLPLPSIGLIWIDREEDPALKEPMEPRYHARDVAWMRAREEQALLVLSSAHLSLEATVQAPQHVLRASVPREATPYIEVVDLRRHDRTVLLSPTLIQAMREAIVRQAGVLLFLNRKAYAGALVCRDCGQVPRCRSCTVALAYSRQKRSVFCHYCGAADAIPDLCAACGGPRLHPIGEGTERVEEEVKRQFPLARILRVDGETMRRAKDAAAMWNRVHRREWDVLIGTQLLLRDDVVPRVGLLGVVQADAGLSVPDFRAAERTYHFLLDASRLVEPRGAGGRLIIQSYLPTHHVIEAVVQQEEGRFRTEEMAHREALGFPPLLRLIALHISGPAERSVAQAAQAWATRLRSLATVARPGSQDGAAACAVGQTNGLTVLGPVLSPVARVRGRYRRQILVKSADAASAVEVVRSTLADLETTYPARQVKFDVDVDPIEMW